MQKTKNIFFGKKILIYGLGKSGISTFNFLKNKSELYLYDDNEIKSRSLKKRKKVISCLEIANKKLDYIILSPGIDIKKCNLSKFLKKNLSKIYTDLDIFFSNYKNKCITITGTNGKSTTSQILYKILLNQKFDARLVGNIGNPILSEKNIKKKTLFIIEASSYQLEYSKIFRSDYAAILNISTDHLERHGTLRNYVKAKFKLIKNQLKGSFSFLNKKDFLIKKEMKLNKYISKHIFVDPNLSKIFLKEIDNQYFATEGNKENLSFVLAIAEKLKLDKKKLFKILKNFKGLNYRQQIIFQRKNLTIINDSKSTSYSSSVSLLKSLSDVYWIIGGIPKKNDKFYLLKKDCKNIKAYIFGKNKKKFVRKIKNKLYFKTFKNLETSVKMIFSDIKKNNKSKHRTILFSPSAASFDSFKNFEERGKYFNKLIYKQLNENY
jgi:UDP-N-acetylmuramoylalanine--D-glutamate ligase